MPNAKRRLYSMVKHASGYSLSKETLEKVAQFAEALGLSKSAFVEEAIDFYTTKGVDKTLLERYEKQMDFIKAIRESHYQGGSIGDKVALIEKKEK